MLQLSAISKRYGDHAVLDGVSFIVNPGERLGLIGPNGCGKSTIMRIIAGVEPADAGAVRFDPPHLRLGYLEQSLTHAPTDTLADLLGPAADPAALEAEMARLGEAMAAAPPPEQTALAAAYADVLTRYEEACSAASEHEARDALAGMGLDHLPPDTPVATLSGGQKTRLGLARLLLHRPDAILLDEPTNHLDIRALEWLEGWLQSYRGAALIVSHDRTFLDRTVTGILALDPRTHEVTAYPGNYSAYLEALERQTEQQWQAYNAQQEEVHRLQEAARRLRGMAKMKRGGKADDGDKFAKGFFRDQSVRTVAKAKVIEGRTERLLNEDRVERPGLTWQMKLDFGATAPSGQDVLMLEDLSAGYGTPLFAGVNEVLRAGERVALVGPNGAGKTTLLKVVTGELAPLAGRARLGASVRLGYLSQEQTGLDPEATALEAIRAVAPIGETEARTFLHRFLFTGDDVFVSAGALSYGERARLALACLVAGGCNFLLLDEPINHLDIPSRERFEQAMDGFGGTVLAVVHDRYFIRRFAGRIWLLAGGALRPCYDLEDLEAKWAAAGATAWVAACDGGESRKATKEQRTQRRPLG